MLHAKQLREKLEVGREYDVVAIYETLSPLIKPEEALQIFRDHHIEPIPGAGKLKRHNKQLKNRHAVKKGTTPEDRIRFGRRLKIIQVLTNAVQSGTLIRNGKGVDRKYTLVAEDKHPTGITVLMFDRWLRESEWVSLEALCAKAEAVADRKTILASTEASYLSSKRSDDEKFKVLVQRRVKNLLGNLRSLHKLDSRTVPAKHEFKLREYAKVESTDES